MTETVQVLKDLYLGQTCYIVGKGPSMQFLDASYFPDAGCVITINEAILVVQILGLSQSIYSMQKDGYPQNMAEPAPDVTLILQTQFSAAWFMDHPKRLLVDPVTDSGLRVPEMSIRMCIALGKMMGCSKLVLVCCDSLTKDEFRTWSPRNHELPAASDPFYKWVKPLVLEDLESINHQIVTPEDKHNAG